MRQLTKKIKLSTTLTLLSGLHIGASKEQAQIGGVDAPIIRRSMDNQPYLPGSSLKGKIRCLLEQSKGVELGKDGDINNLFGSSAADDGAHASKVIVRDAYLTKGSAVSLEQNENTDLPFAEVKFENSIDRIKGQANQGIRQIERIPAGAAFEVEFIINVWDDDSENELIGLLNEGIKLLRNDYLGGSGSRGYGALEIGDLSQEVVFSGAELG